MENDGVRIPLEDHPYSHVEEAIQAKDSRLALLHNQRLNKWIIAQYVGRPFPTVPALKGIPGIEGAWCNWCWVFTLHTKQGMPICPEHYMPRILWALDRMDTHKKGGLTPYLDELEDMNKDQEAEVLSRCRQLGADIAREAWWSKGRIVSTPHGTFDLDKLYARFRPGLDKKGKKTMIEIAR